MCLSAFAAVFAGGKSDSFSYKKLEKKYPQSEYFFRWGTVQACPTQKVLQNLVYARALEKPFPGNKKHSSPTVPWEAGKFSFHQHKRNCSFSAYYRHRNKRNLAGKEW